MKRFIKSLVLVTLLVVMTVPAWAQTPSTEGRDFWVTFLRADRDRKDEQLKLTISAMEACSIHIENTSTGYAYDDNVAANSCTEVIVDANDCYSDNNTAVTNTALHVTATANISLFAGNYHKMSFDAANVLPTAALMDEYLIQTYPPSDHENYEKPSEKPKPQGSHFAVIAVEEGQTTIDYTLSVNANGKAPGTYNVTLNKGEVFYVWTGLSDHTNPSAYDLSGTKVKARNGKKIAVFQGCPQTNLPIAVRHRDHLFSQAMPTVYWGSEFGITASRKHRRDIVAIMAINDGTEVYINEPDGEKTLVHTFNFNSSDPQERKQYWTFEIGEELAYCADKPNQSPTGGQRLDEPLVIDSSCYLTTSCPVGVHLFMVSCRYDNLTAKVDDDTLVSDPAMLWISPIEQVIKEVNFSTYDTPNGQYHFMNIVTPTANVDSMKWNGNYISQYFHRMRGDSTYSFARIQINHGTHNLKGTLGFSAHVYGYGTRESYAYSCGSSTVIRSVTFNDTPLQQDSIYQGKFCVNEPIEMKLNIGNNEYESIEWLFGDGTSYVPGVDIPNEQKTKTTHTYTTPGWYDLVVSAVYVNRCTGERSNGDPMRFSFYVARQDTVVGEVKASECVDLATYKANPVYWDSLIVNGEIQMSEPVHCYDTVFVNMVKYRRETEEFKDTIHGWNEAVGYNGRTYRKSTDVVDSTLNTSGCKHFIRYYVDVIQCLDLEVRNIPDPQYICPGKNLEVHYSMSKGEIKNEEARFVVPGLVDTTVTIRNSPVAVLDGELELPTYMIKEPGFYTGTLTVEDVNCDPKVYTIHFAVDYPEDIFKFKFNNVLAVYQNTDYQFTAYQWYLNGLPVEGATSSILYLGENTIFQEGDVVYVMLTDKNGMVLPSCPKTLTDIDPDMDNEASQAPARKILINNQFIIRKDNSDYDIYGQRVR